MCIFLTLEAQKEVGGLTAPPPSSPGLHHSMCYVCQFLILASRFNNITKRVYNKSLNNFGLSTSLEDSLGGLCIHGRMTIKGTYIPYGVV